MKNLLSKLKGRGLEIYTIILIMIAVYFGSRLLLNLAF
jgi:hypothetical protein